MTSLIMWVSYLTSLQTTHLLSAIGGLTGGKSVTSKQFTWQTVDNAAAAQTAAVKELTQVSQKEAEVK